MPTLTITSLGNVVPDQKTEASEVMDAFYKEGMLNNSLEIINGHLDTTNLRNLDSIGISQIKQNALVNGKMIGQTGNLDYTNRTFPNTSEDAGAFTPIPGASVEFYLPYDCSLVIFTWMVTALNTMNYSTSGTTTATSENTFRFVVDGDSKQVRSAPPGQDTSSTGSPAQQHRTRLWSGQYLAQGSFALTKGWHSAGVEIFINEGMSRVRIRNIKVLWFK